MNPLSGVGLLFRHPSDAGAEFLGTCFAFRQPTHYLTAAHCVGNLGPHELAIGLPLDTRREVMGVKTLIRKPGVDLAILVLQEEYTPRIQPFRHFGGNFVWGEDFIAYGFPEDVFGGGTTPLPTARMFKGHFQRYMQHRSQVYPFEYNAGEMSIPAPAGLSGGPIFRAEVPTMVKGLVTENHQSTTFLQSVEEHQDGPVTSRSSVHEVIQYGVALLLDSQAAFLDQHVPPPAS